MAMEVESTTRLPLLVILCGNKSGHDDSSLHSCQELLGDQGAEPVVFDNEFADVFVQAALKNSVHAAVLQPRANSARLPLRRTLPVIGTRNGSRLRTIAS